MSDERRRLLIVEDDPALQTQMKWAFSDFEVAVASDCDEAVVQLRRAEPAVVTLDLGLPPAPDEPTEGLRTLQTLLSLAPDTKIVVLTGQNDRGNALKAIANGAYDFYAKPFEPDVLDADHRARVQAARARVGEPAPRLRPDADGAGKPDHPGSGDAACLPYGGEGRSIDRDGHDPRRIRDRQGASGAWGARIVAAA